MIDEKLFLKIAENNFHIFEVFTEKEIEIMNKIYPRKDILRDFIKNKIVTDKEKKLELPEKIRIEMYLLLAEFCIKNKIEPLECCAIFKIISDTFNLIGNKKSKTEIFERLKKFLITFAMDRFSKQIGILKKQTVYLITDFFVDYIYKRFDLIHYCLTDKDNIILEKKEYINYTLPKVDDISTGIQSIPRNNKILRQYFESHRPKTELEQKIEMILEFEREKLDKKMEKIFQEQDSEFNTKVEELLFKKKK